MFAVRVFLLSLVAGVTWSLTAEELAAFKPVDPDHVDVNTGLKPESWAKDNGDGSQTIYTNGIPSHPTWKFPDAKSGNPNYVKLQDINMMIYSEPIMRDEPFHCLPMAYIGIATSGTPMFSWFPAQEKCIDVHDFEELDICEGHPDEQSVYHYHYFSPCTHMPTCNKPSSIWGVALDGIPIYGPIDEDGRQLAREDLDECGGKVDSTGRYKYHITIDPPYFMGCLKGEIRSDVKEDKKPFFCSCPFDDRMFKRGPRPQKRQPEDLFRPPPPGPMTTPSCNFSTNGSEPAVCSDNYDRSYDIGYEWKWTEKQINMAPCCPPGVDCGASCKTASGIKDECYVETRNVSYWTRMKKQDLTKLEESKEETKGIWPMILDEGTKNMEWSALDEGLECMTQCLENCSTKTRMHKANRRLRNERCAEECVVLCSITDSILEV